MSSTASDLAPIGPSKKGLLARIGNFIVWYTIPAVAILLATAYVGAAVIWDVNPPAIPVAGDSMEPTIEAGDLVFIKGIEPDEVEKGDIVAVRVPDTAQEKYGLPEAIVHRVTKIKQEPGGNLLFETQGDANSGPDVFETRGPDIVGVFYKRIEDAGLPFLFFRSRQGYIFLAAAALVLVLYILFGVLEERRFAAQAGAVTMHTVLAETLDLKQSLGLAPAAVPRAPPDGDPDAAAHLEGAPSDPTSQLPALQPLSGFDWLARKVEDSAVQNEQVGRTMRDLVGAVGEYGRHLQSHTDVMKNLAMTTAELQRATEAMRALFERGGVGTDPTSLQEGMEDDQGMPAAPFDSVEPTESIGETSITPPPDLLLVPPPPSMVPPAPAGRVPPAPSASVPPAPGRAPRPPQSGPPPPPRTRPPAPE